MGLQCSLPIARSGEGMLFLTQYVTTQSITQRKRVTVLPVHFHGKHKSREYMYLAYRKSGKNETV